MRKRPLKLTEKCADSKLHCGKSATRTNISEQTRVPHVSLLRRGLLLASITGLAAATASAQWQIVTPAPTTADLRGIDNVGNGVAWASGTDGTVLRTEDAGYLWQRCTIPPGAEHLDFRGIQAFDANTAIVMSSGKGPLSRLYKTTDGCQTWTLVFTNPDKAGSFGALQNPESLPRHGKTRLALLGDPVKGHFIVWEIRPFAAPEKIARPLIALPGSHPGQAVFAASNSSLFVYNANFGFFNPTGKFWFGTGGRFGARIFSSGESVRGGYFVTKVPIGDGKDSSGIFSIGFARLACQGTSKPCFVRKNVVAVGGDYELSDDEHASAAFSSDYGDRWHPATAQPHGFRSAVAYDAPTRTWITVGPNGTDISSDDGQNWRALRPDLKLGDASDADQHWNALSLPYVVGPHGRIGILRRSAIESTEAGK